jgi:hypothetical protein
MRARLIIAGFGVTIGVGVSWLSTGAGIAHAGVAGGVSNHGRNGRRTRLHRQTVD